MNLSRLTHTAGRSSIMNTCTSCLLLCKMDRKIHMPAPVAVCESNDCLDVFCRSALLHTLSTSLRSGRRDIYTFSPTSCITHLLLLLLLCCTLFRKETSNEKRRLLLTLASSCRLFLHYLLPYCSAFPHFMFS